MELAESAPLIEMLPELPESVSKFKFPLFASTLPAILMLPATEKLRLPSLEILPVGIITREGPLCVEFTVMRASDFPEVETNS